MPILCTNLHSVHQSYHWQTNWTCLLQETHKVIKTTSIWFKVKIIKELKAQWALSARTSSDLRGDTENKILMEEIDQHSLFDGRFLLTRKRPHRHACVYWWCAVPQDLISSSRHCQFIQPFCLSKRPTAAPWTSPTDSPCSKVRLISHEAWRMEGWTQQLWPRHHQAPLQVSECESFGILIPPKGRPTCLSFVTDGDYLLPII